MSPEERTEAIQTLAGRVTGDTLAAAPLLHAARGEKDYVLLGFESWAQYLDQVGVSRSQDSKLRSAYAFFGPEWAQLIFTQEATLERLYLGARIGKREGLDIGSALALARSTPAYELVARLKGEELEPTLCVCDACGQSHKRKEPA